MSRRAPDIALEGVLGEFGGDAKSKLDALMSLSAKISQEENGPLTPLQESILAALDGKVALGGSPVRRMYGGRHVGALQGWIDEDSREGRSRNAQALRRMVPT